MQTRTKRLLFLLRLPKDVEQLDVEDQSRVRRDGLPGAALPVGETSGDEETVAAADRHHLKRFGPTGDHLIDAELGGFAAADRAVEFAAVEKGAGVVNPDPVGGGGFCAIALFDDLILEPGGGDGDALAGDVFGHELLFRGGVGGSELFGLPLGGLLHPGAEGLHGGGVLLGGEAGGTGEEIAHSGESGLLIDFDGSVGEVLAHIHPHGVAELFEFIGEIVHDSSLQILLFFPENELLPYSRNRRLSSAGKGPLRIAFRQSFKKTEKNAAFCEKFIKKREKRGGKGIEKNHPLSYSTGR